MLYSPSESLPSQVVPDTLCVKDCPDLSVLVRQPLKIMIKISVKSTKFILIIISACFLLYGNLADIYLADHKSSPGKAVLLN